MLELVLLNSAWGGLHLCPGSWFDSLQHISITPSWIVTGPLFGDLVGRRKMVEGGCEAHSSLSLDAAVVPVLGKWPHDAAGCVPPAGGGDSVRSVYLFQILASCPLSVNKWL